MQKDFILEIESSETRCPDVVVQQQESAESTHSHETTPPAGDASRIEKYIRFRVKRRTPQSMLTLNTTLQLVLGALFVFLIYHTLSMVDPVRQVAEFCLQRGAAFRSASQLQRLSFARGLLRSAQRLARAGSDVLQKFSLASVVNLVYLALAAEASDWLFWQLDDDVEESLLIVPQLGVQTECAMVRKRLGKLWLRYLIALTRQLAAPLAKQHTSRPSCSAWDRLDRALAKNERVVVSREFVAMEYVKGLVINEGFCGMQVVFYLALVTIDTSCKTAEQERLKMVLVFRNLLPRRKLLEAVWQRGEEVHSLREEVRKGIWKENS